MQADLPTPRSGYALTDPSAMSYIDERRWKDSVVALSVKSYEGYPPYA